MHKYGQHQWRAAQADLQIMSPLQNAEGAGQRQAMAAGKQLSAFQKVTVT